MGLAHRVSVGTPTVLETTIVLGRGSGSPAKLNYGDCMPYALAKVTGEPLLFKGDHFAHTDITPAL